MADLFSSAKTREEQLALVEQIPVATRSMQSGTLAIEGAEVQALRSAFEAGDTAAFDQRFGSIQQNFAGAFDQASSRLQTAQLNLANATAGDPSAGMEQRQEIERRQAELQQFSNIFGTDVPDFSGSFAQVDGEFRLASEVAPATPGRTVPKMGVVGQADGTYALTDAATGEVLESGFTLQDALARQVELQSGAMPDAVGAFAQEEATTSLMDAVMGTDGSLSANVNFVNGAFQAYLGRDATQAELDMFAGQTVNAVRNALQAGASGEESTASIGDIDVPEVITTDVLTDLTSDPVTQSDIAAMLGRMEAQQQEFMATLVPTEEEQDIKQQIIDLRAQAEAMLVSLSAGIDDITDQPIAMEFITGQAASLERRAETRLQNLSRIEANLLDRLGLAQEARAVEASIAETQLGFLQTNLNTHMQVREMLANEEDRLFNRAMALQDDARTVLGFVLDTFAGIDEDDLTSDQRIQLMQLSETSGIPYSLVTAGLSNVKEQLMYESALESGAFDIRTSTDYLEIEEVSDIKAIAEFNNALRAYRELIFDVGGANFFTPSDRDRLDAMKTAAELAAKDAFELGAITAADAAMIDSLLPDVTKLIVTPGLAPRAMRTLDEIIQLGEERAGAAYDLLKVSDYGAATSPYMAELLKDFSNVYIELPSGLDFDLSTDEGISEYQDYLDLYYGSPSAFSTDLSTSVNGSNVLALGAITGYGSPYWDHGLDIDLKIGDRVPSPVSGVVEFVGQNGGFGNQVRIRTSRGASVWLSHLDSFAVQKGQRVAMGQIIGAGGNTGSVIPMGGGDGSHLDLTVLNPDGSFMSPQDIEKRLRAFS